MRVSAKVAVIWNTGELDSLVVGTHGVSTGLTNIPSSGEYIGQKVKHRIGYRSLEFATVVVLKLPNQVHLAQEMKSAMNVPKHTLVVEFILYNGRFVFALLEPISLLILVSLLMCTLAFDSSERQKQIYCKISFRIDSAVLSVWGQLNK